MLLLNQLKQISDFIYLGLVSVCCSSLESYRSIVFVCSSSEPYRPIVFVVVHWNLTDL